MSNRFSRNRSRAQPTPHVCKSKHITPGAPPPFSADTMQVFLQFTAPEELELFPTPYIGTLQRDLATLGYHGILKPGPTEELVWNVFTQLPDGQVFALVEAPYHTDPYNGWTIEGEDFIYDQPYNSGLIQVLRASDLQIVGVATLIV